MIAGFTALMTGLLALGSCSKVPIYDVEAGFVLADAAWFAEEDTLFVFYEVTAQQGLGDPSVIEITYATDDERVPWTIITDLPAVHTHEPVDCGAKSLCGSTSLRVPIEPREVAIRLRYHYDGELALNSRTVFNVVGLGDPHSHRSLVVYGVFDETNQDIQWRGRHQFPTIRNHQAQQLGLRRDFLVEDQRYGDGITTSFDNPYGYAINCPSSFVEANLEDLETSERAVFNAESLPIEASAAAMVCARTTVTDATDAGTFTADAIARKNPEVRAAFPVLRSPVRDATTLPFFLAPCDRTISEEHEEMQRQRLLLGDLAPYCIDDWEDPGFVDRLVVDLSDAVEDARPDGEDMVLLLGLHHDDIEFSRKVEEALAQIVPEERHRSTPRLAGAFVFDSIARTMEIPELGPVALWCPAAIPTGDGSDLIGPNSLACAILPENPNFELGPLSFSALPILTSRQQYLEFIDTYSVNQAGSMTDRTFRAPEFAVTADHIDFGNYGVVTFLNEEFISADADDAFSYCITEEIPLFVFRSGIMQSDIFAGVIAQYCENLGLEEEICATAEQGLLPLSYLSQWHEFFKEDTYELGLFWEFPFLTEMRYEVVAAGSVSAFGLSVPFGRGEETESNIGSEMWSTEEFSLEELLTQCLRFCDHPTFDSAGVYHVTDPFRSTYADDCYLPDYPLPGDSGFPLDP